MAKKKEIDTTNILDAIRKRFGTDSVIEMSDAPTTTYDVIPTGSVGLDKALGIGGYPRGRIVEIYGPESSGKTTLTLHAIAEAQRLGLRCAFIDAEHAIDTSYAAKLGVDTSALVLVQPDYGEQALEICDMMAHSGDFGLIIVDSVAALAPKAELDGEVGDSHVGLQARMMGQALRKMTGAAAKGKTCVIFINQLRMKIGVVYGSPETTPGGNALKYYCSVRLDIRRVSGVKGAGSETFTANRTRVKVKKNKTSPPFTEAEFDIEFGTGISRTGEIIDFGVEQGIINKSGAWFTYGDTKLGQGKEKAKDFLADNPDIVTELVGKILGA